MEGSTTRYAGGDKRRSSTGSCLARLGLLRACEAERQRVVEAQRTRAGNDVTSNKAKDRLACFALWRRMRVRESLTSCLPSTMENRGRIRELAARHAPVVAGTNRSLVLLKSIIQIYSHPSPRSIIPVLSRTRRAAISGRDSCPRIPTPPHIIAAFVQPCRRPSPDAARNSAVSSHTQSNSLFSQMTRSRNPDSSVYIIIIIIIIHHHIVLTRATPSSPSSNNAGSEL